jgi:hypothetical protein
VESGENWQIGEKRGKTAKNGENRLADFYWLKLVVVVAGQFGCYWPVWLLLTSLVITERWARGANQLAIRVRTGI